MRPRYATQIKSAPENALSGLLTIMRVIDKAAPGFADLQAKVLEPGFPWHYARATREQDGEENPWLRSWVHMIYDHGHWYSQAGDFILGQVIAMMGAVGEPLRSIYRVRVG